LEVLVVVRPAETFDEYVARSGTRLLTLAYLLCGNPADADDLVQEALARAYLYWPRLASAVDLDAYVRRLVVNANRRRFRRRRVTEIAGGSGTEPGGGHGVYVGVEDRFDLAAALASLPVRQRTVVVLRYYEDLSEAEVAALLGCCPGTVKSQASKAIAKLRNHPSLRTLPAYEKNGVQRV
jgi:RNA polymerase sigma-70 factor (sigma-E family)